MRRGALTPTTQRKVSMQAEAVTAQIPRGFLRLVFSWRFTVLRATFLPILLLSGAGAAVQYAKEHHAIDFSAFEEYHTAHLMISIFLLAFGVSDAIFVWRKQLEKIADIRAASHALVLLLASHAKDKQEVVNSILPFREAVLAAVWVGFAIVDPSLSEEAVAHLPAGVFEGIQGTPCEDPASPTKYQSALGALPRAEQGGEAKVATESQGLPDGATMDKASLLNLSMVDLLLEEAAAHAISAEDNSGWLNAGAFHFAFNSQLLKLHGTLVSMAHEAEVNYGTSFGYIHLLSVNILCLCLFTPFGLTAAGWLNPLFSGTIALTYGGLLIITRELSQPFRCEPRHRGINLRATAQALARDWVGGANSTLLAKLVRREHARRSSLAMLGTMSSQLSSR